MACVVGNLKIRAFFVRQIDKHGKKSNNEIDTSQVSKPAEPINGKQGNDTEEQQRV